MKKYTKKIRAIFGREPGREGEYPGAWIVGHKPPGYAVDICDIQYREDNYGDHGIGWFDVYTGIDGNRQLHVSINVRDAAEVHYVEDAPDD